MMVMVEQDDLTFMSSHNIKTEVQLSEILQSVGAEHLEVLQKYNWPVEIPPSGRP